jgi:hypothetical protein
MKTRAIATLVALGLSAALSAPALACTQGETKFQNGVQYTCMCNTLASGQTACVWRAD